MRWRPLITWRRLGIGFLGLILAAIAGAVLLAYSGLYSVAASKGHPAWLNWFLETGMERSVKLHAGGEKGIPDLSQDGLAQLGAGHFQGGCASCHGGPGEPVNPVYDHMLPSPPKLEDHAGDWDEQELFWIVKHGIQYAGMPAWSGEGRDDEVWSVVAFLERLPDLSEEDYRRLARGNEASTDAGPGPNGLIGIGPAPLRGCDRCHDTPDAPPVSGYVPRLGGQSADYLERALRDYYTDHRQSGIMEPVTAELEEGEFASIAAWYAEMSSPAYTGADAPNGDIARGRMIAEQGYGNGRIPSCNSCHGAQALPDYPRLAGQPAPYIETQLTLWQKGGRAQTPHGRLMAPIAKRLSEEQIRDVAAYYESLAAGEGE